MVDVGRRKFLGCAGLAAAGAAVSTMVPPQAKQRLLPLVLITPLTGSQI
jgi:hypothetical protein